MPQCFVTNVDILIVLSNSDTCNVAVLPVKKLHTHTHPGDSSALIRFRKWRRLNFKGFGLTWLSSDFSKPSL